MPPLRIGLIGSGGISRAHMPAFLEHRDEVELVAVCDIREEAAQAYAADAGVDPSAVYTDAAELLARDDVEAVDIATIHSAHHGNAIQAAKAGKHVLLEKPMACSVQEARDIVSACDDNGVTFMVAQMLRYLPHYQNVKRIIEDGELGDIWACRADSWFGAALPGSMTSMNRGDWWGFDGKRNGGGSVMMVSTHQVDLLRYFVGNVVRITARTWGDHPLMKNGAEDRAVATFEFDNGAMGTLLSSYSARTPWMYQSLILGTKGTIYTEPPLEGNVIDQHHAPARIASEAREIEPGHNGFEAFTEVAPRMEGMVSKNPFTNEIVHFARCIREGKEPISSGHDNLNTMEAVHGVYAAAEAGHTVEVADL